MMTIRLLTAQWRFTPAYHANYFLNILLLLMLLIGLCTSFIADAADTTFYFKEPEKQATFRELTAELRCPMCQNQNIADSNAMIALDLKRKTYELVQQGKSKQEVIDYMKARYGDFVHYQPPVTPVTVWLWLFPFLFIVFAAGMMIRTKLRAKDATGFSVSQNRNAESGESKNRKSNTADGPNSESDVKRADALMEKYK